VSVERYVKSVPPSTEMIQSMIDADINLKIALSELIANSLGQESTQIDITLNKQHYLEELIFSDNGNGCPNLELMVMIGSHVPSRKGGESGRYGVGFKDATIWCGDTVIVDSCTRGGKKERADVNWAMIKATHKWDIGFSDDSDLVSHGVTIRIGDLRRNRITRGWKYVASYIAERFSAAIDGGVVFTVDGKRVQSRPRPLLLDEVSFLVKFNGRVARGFCGILVDKSVSSGWEVRYGAQTIVANCKEGFGEYSPAGFWGMLYMIDDEQKWQLTRNKTSSENLEDMLYCPDLQKVIAPLLEKLQRAAKEMSMNLSSQLVMEELNKMLISIKASGEEISITSVEEKQKEDTVPSETPRGPDKKPRQSRGPKDALSQTKKLFKGINCIKIRPIEGDGKSLGDARLVSRGTLLMVEIDNSTETGKNICENPTLLRHTAVTLIALLFGTREDLPFQLSFHSLGEMPPMQEKISRICAWLLKHVRFDELKANSSVV
jgi:Histidine kinase-, DNA gyrase B-, and HSP90-like ATPase